MTRDDIKNSLLGFWGRNKPGCGIRLHGHRVARDPTCGPGSLKVETSGDSIQIEQLASEEKAGANTAFHGFEIYLLELHAAAGNEFVLVQALAGNLEFGLPQMIGEVVDASF